MCSSGLHELDPFLTPDWRWRDVGEIVQNGPIAELPADPAILAATAFRAELEGISLTTQAPPDARTITALRRAHQIFKQDGFARAELEAYVLSGLPVDKIAAKCQLPIEVVQVYESTFFDVRPHLHAIDWVLKQVVGPCCWGHFADEDFRPFLARSALLGGSSVVDRLLRDYRTVWRSDEPLRLRRFLDPVTPLSIRAYVALTLLPLHKSAELLVDLHARLREADANPDPIQAEMLRSQVRIDTVQCAIAVLDGKPLPARERRPVKRADVGNAQGKDSSPHSSAPHSGAVDGQPAVNSPAMEDWLDRWLPR